MRYRALSPTGDYQFGQGKSEFLVNTPETVAQAVKTRLQLVEGEWFLDETEGTPYQLILGHGTENTYDQAIQERIANTPGVTEIDEYASNLDRNTRKVTIACTITTLYGQTSVQALLG